MKKTVIGVALAVGLLAILQASSEAQGPGGDRGARDVSLAAAERETPSGESGSVPGKGAGSADLGRQVYLARCTACHNPDPSKDGRVGPAVKGSTLELVRTRVLWAAYPQGYSPKRRTRIMPPQPDLVSRIADLAAYLHAR